MNKTVFFDAVRASFGKLTDAQVQSAEGILDAATKRGLSDEHTAYILATAWGEANLTPQRENMSYSATGIRKTWPHRPEAVKFARKPKELANSVYGGRNGNRPGTDDGWVYRGGGLDQTTGRDNYTKVGLATNPNGILQVDRAVDSIVSGMVTGRYRGFKLSSYGDGQTFKPVAARAIINADGKTKGSLYAGYYSKFLSAIIKAGGIGSSAPVATHVRPKADAPKTGLAWLVGVIGAAAALAATYLGVR